MSSLWKLVTCARYLSMYIGSLLCQILLEKVINLGFPPRLQTGCNASVTRGTICPREKNVDKNCKWSVVGISRLTSWDSLKTIAKFSWAEWGNTNEGQRKSGFKIVCCHSPVCLVLSCWGLFAFFDMHADALLSPKCRTFISTGVQTSVCFFFLSN